MVFYTKCQVVTEQKPVVGLRLYLEGRKSDRLALHVHHLSSLPNTMVLSSDTSTLSAPSIWRGSDDHESSNQFLEPIKWKRFSNVCTSVVKHDPNWLNGSGGVYIVTGAQILSKGSWPRNVLHLRLQFTHIPNCSIRKSEWAGAPEGSRKSSFLTNLSTTFSFTQQSNTAPRKQAPAALNSGIYPDGPPVPVRSGKLLKYVETAEVVRGPHDAPGHWLVTAAKLVTDGGKIGIQVKFALLDYWWFQATPPLLSWVISLVVICSCLNFVFWNYRSHVYILSKGIVQYSIQNEWQLTSGNRKLKCGYSADSGYILF